MHLSVHFQTNSCGDFRRPFRTSPSTRVHQTLRVWLISNVAPRQLICGRECQVALKFGGPARRKREKSERADARCYGIFDHFCSIKRELDLKKEEGNLGSLTPAVTDATDV